MHLPFRALIATQDTQVRLVAENLLRTVQAKCLHGESQDSILAYLGTPEGIDLVVVDSSWDAISVEMIYRACRSRTKAPVETYLAVLVEETNAAGAIMAFNSGADAVIRRNIDPVEFLNACRAGQRLSVLAKMHRVAMEAKESAAAALGEAEQSARDAEAAAAALVGESEAEVGAAPAAAVLQGASGFLIDPLNKAAKVRPVGDAPVVVQQFEAVARQVLIDQGATETTCAHDPDDAEALDGGIPEWSEFIGWQGIFWPVGNLWFDVIFHFSRTGAENLCRWSLQRSAKEDASLLNGINQYLVAVQATYRAHYETGYGPTSTILCQPVAMARPFWTSEAGRGDYSRVLKFPNSFLAYNFHIAPAALQVKSAIAASPGDVLNETIAAKGQRPGPGVLPLANRGIILTEGRLNKIVPDLEANRTLWVIEPSLFARRIGAMTAVD